MKKNIVFLIIIFIVLTMTSCNTNVGQRSDVDSKIINKLISHFESTQLMVNKTIIPEDEKAYAQKVGKQIEEIKKKYALKTSEEKAPVEKSFLTINSIEVRIYRYKSEKTAELAYNDEVARQQRKYERSIRQKTPYFKAEYLLNKKLVMQINHFNVSLNEENIGPLKGGLTPNQLELNEDDLKKIKEAFNSFNP